jgi:hypothetical protein
VVSCDDDKRRKINVIEFEKTFVSLARVRKVKAPRRSLTLFFRCLQTHKRNLDDL